MCDLTNLRIVRPGFSALSSDDVQVLSSYDIILLDTRQDINILFITNFFQHCRAILQGVITDPTMCTKLQISPVLVRTVGASVPFFVTNKALSRSTTSYFSTSNEPTGSSERWSSIVISTVVASSLVSLSILIIGIVLLCVLCYSISLVDSLVVLSIFEVEMAVGRVVICSFAYSTPGGFAILHVVGTVGGGMVSSFLADVTKRFCLYKMDILSAELLSTVILRMSGC